MKIDNFFAELKRRNVYKVAVAYAVVAWLTIQGASIFLPAFNAPQWAMQIVILVVVVGFPIALVFSWAFEITPEGIVRESTVQADESITHHTGRKLVALTIVLAVVAVGLFVFQLIRARSTPPSAATITNKSIAVLPFENLSDDKQNAYFAEGVQDEILTRLAKIADLKVISRTSTQHFKSAPDNLPQIAKQLGVAHILEGSVQKANDQVRVNVQLINALTDAHLWADTFDRKLTDIFAVESEIAKTIAETLQAKLTGSEEKAMSKTPTANPEAYELYLQGRFFWAKRTGPDLRKSIDYFNRAIAKDPNYAVAYAGLAQSLIVISSYDGGAPAESCPQAEAAARKALSIDANSSEALAVLASFKALYEFDFAGALKEYERALQINPNDATTHHWFGLDTLASLGQQERELAELKRALELDPLSLVINSNLGVGYIHNGRLEDAIAQSRKTIEMDSSFYYARLYYGEALELQGKIPEAIAQYEKATAVTDDPVALGTLGHIYGVAGRKDEARKIFEKLRELRAHRYIAAYSLVLVSLGLDDRTEAIKWLEQGYQDRDGNFLGGIRVDPLLNALHGDPRFEALAEKVVPAKEFRAAPK
ncbi:MAG: tetratricopeptide repeat protein [Verrucomicrobiota bacterium]|nr:tetratricopeptide repeat protein [Verrucomicrobiota bacterium]